MAAPALRQKTICRPSRFSLEGLVVDDTLLPDRDGADHRDRGVMATSDNTD